MDELAAALASNRAAIERALPQAEAELATCRARCQELEDSIRTARLISGGPLDIDARSATGDRQVTLREAMIIVLREHPTGLPAPQIADEIERRGLYHRRDGKPAGGGQVHNRVHHYPAQFIRDNGRIRLRTDND